MKGEAALTETRVARPLTVKLYAAVYVLSALVALVTNQFDSLVAPLIGSAIGFLVFIFPIWRGSKVGWIIIFVLTLPALVLVFVPSSPLPEGVGYRDQDGGIDILGLVTTLSSLALLVHPQTQRWCKVRL
jgi:hypothetical protein